MKWAWIWPPPLNAQIKQAECQVSIRQQRVGVRAATLARQVGRNLTTPSSLLLACGIGFGLGELTRRQPPPSSQGTTDTPRTADASPLRAAVNFFATAHTLYAALPIAWTTRFWRQACGPSEPAPERQFQTDDPPA